MSTTIDQRVVEMKFDNSHFEKNVSTTMSTLEKLKQGLNLTGAVKGLENVDTAARKINLSGLTSAVETIHTKFSAMEVMAVTALANITNSAVNAGKKIVSALTIDPIKTGFAEYETQINAVQTILANTSSKGTTINDVNKALDTLNTYADKTIYNFTEMTRNIGTFTAAGVDLDKSVSAIQGIANLAAVSGSTSQQASTAMYQLSQALSSGTVKLQDWNSVVNAGMGGQVFQDALKRTAKNMGTNVDALIEKYGSFRESLSQGEWLTADVLTETLKQFTMAAEEGTAQWEEYKKSLKEQGYTEEQAIEILKMANTATDAATKVKTFTQLWDTLKESVQSGWTQSWEIVVGDFEEAKELLTSVSDTLGAMIGASAEARNKMLQDWKDLGGRTALIDAIKNAFEGVMKIVTPVKEAFSEVFPPTTGQQLLDLTEGLKNLTEKFKMFAEKIAPNLKTTFKGLFSVVALIRDGFLAVVNAVKPLAGYLFKVLDGTLSLTASFAEYVTNLKDSVKVSDKFNDILDTLGGVIKRLIERFKPLEAMGTVTKKIVNGITDAISSAIPAFAGLGTSVAEAFGTGGKTFNTNGLLDLFNSGVFAGILVTIKKLVDGFEELAEPITGFKDNLIDMFDGVKDCLSAYQSQLKAGTLLKIASALAVLAASLLALSLVDPTRLTSALVGVTALLTELVGAMYVLQMMADKKKVKALKKLVSPMISLSVAVLILASAMTKIAKLNWNELAKGLLGIAGAAAVLVASATVLSKNEGKVIKGAGSLVIFAAAINVLALAVKQLGGLNVNALIKGLGGVGVLIAELALFMKVADLDGMGLLKGLGIVALSGAIVILANAVKQFASLNVNQLIKGLGAVAVVLAELAIFTNLTGNASKVISTSIGLTILAGAMTIFASAISTLGMMDTGALVQGLIGMAGALTIMAVAMHTMNGTLAGSAAMLVMAGALAVFVPQLIWLSTMSLSEIGTGLLALAGAFTVVGVAGLVLGPLTPVLLSLAGAVALFGVAALAVGAGILAFSAGLSALAVSGVAGAGALVTIVTTISGLIPMMIAQLANGVIMFANIIAQGAPAIGAAITSVILSVIQTITISIPAVVNAIFQLLTSLLTTLLNYMPTLMQTGANLVISILQGVANNISKVVQKGIEIAVNFINGVASMIGVVVQSGVNLVISFVNGLANAIRNNGSRFVDAVWNLFDAIIDTAIYVLTSSIGNITQIGGKIINGLCKGISGVASGVKNAVKNVITGAVNTLNGFVSKFKTIGSNIIQGVVNGIKNGASSIVNAATSMASKALNAAKKFLGINSPSRAFAEVGKYADQGFAKGLERYANVASSAAEGVGDKALTSLNNSLANIDLGAIDTQPVVKPVLDMSNITSGANTLNSLFANGKTLLLGADVDTSFLGRNLNSVSSMMSNNQNGSNRDIVQAIKDLRDDVTGLAHVMGNMQMVTDTGALVGEISYKMDRALGVLTGYKGRGN